MIQPQEFLLRRQQLLNKIDQNSIALLFSASEVLRNGDVHFPFRQDSSFYYFTGFLEPESVAIFIPNRKEGQFILFNRPRNEALEKWQGPRAGQKGAREVFGADEAFKIEELDEKILELLLGRQKIYYEIGKNHQIDQRVISWLTKLQAQNRKELRSPSELVDITSITHEMRLFKSHHEVAVIKRATEISAQAHCRAMQVCQPGLSEYELEIALTQEFLKYECRNVAYPSIVGGGANSCILHYIDNSAPLRDGDLVLIDAGVEYEYYAADITRTFPVNGRFTNEQATIYELVLSAQLAVIEAIRPGVRWNRLQEIAVEYLAKGLQQLGILEGTLENIIQNKTYQNYYMHNIGHWLGLDVHDAGNYKQNKEWRLLEPGMVLTVEPGLYLSANNSLAKKWWDIGVRIEDDVLVTDEGCEVLSSGVPKTIHEIEDLMHR